LTVVWCQFQNMDNSHPKNVNTPSVGLEPTRPCVHCILLAFSTHWHSLLSVTQWGLFQALKYSHNYKFVVQKNISQISFIRLLSGIIQFSLTSASWNRTKPKWCRMDSSVNNTEAARRPLWIWKGLI